MPLPYANHLIPNTIPNYQVKPEYKPARVATQAQYRLGIIQPQPLKVKLSRISFFSIPVKALFHRELLAGFTESYYTMNVLVTASATKNHKEDLK
jgi:hypothetical protein